MTAENTVLVLVDVQGRLAESMHDRDALYDNLQRLIKGMQALQVPIIWVEQIPEKMGATIPQVAALLTSEHPIRKTCFSCCGSEEFRNKLQALNRRQVVVAGIEAHVCIYQTAADLAKDGYAVEVVADAVSSRTLANKQIALQRIQGLAGAGVISVEMGLFELAKTAEHPAFRELLKIVK